jgi:two-component system, cell cycle sensor histidine kinase and response regulator CckA
MALVLLEVAAMNDPPRAKPHDRPVILLAEDEPVVRRFVETALVYAGYDVLTAADGAEALKLSRSYRGTIDLVLSDVKMPNMIGPELAMTIVKERPGIHVMLMTGKSSGEIPMMLRQDLLRKPFPPKRLLERIARVLASDNG